MSCIVCGHPGMHPLFSSSDRLYHTTNRRFTVAKCVECGLMQLDPLPAPAELHAYYPENYWFSPDESAAGRMEEAYRRLVLRDHVAFVARALRESGESGPILDVGCGGGLFLGMLKERGFPVLGLDFSREAAAVAGRRHGVTVLCADFERVPVREESCAAVTMFHVLEHLHQPGAYLETARRLLKPRGRLVVQVPNADCWQFRLLREAWTGIDVPRHLADFRARDLERLLTGRGFHVVRRKHFSLRDNPAGLASSLAPLLDPMARRIRRIAEGGLSRLAKNLAYLSLVAAALPFTAVEAACGAGSTLMIEASKR